MTEEQDPFDFLFPVSEISPSQEDLLRLCAFPGESVNAGDMAPPSSSLFPADSAGLLLCSLPETQDAGKGASGSSGTQEQEDVFHTPPEKSSVPSSGDQPSDHCTLNQELGTHDDALGFVDLGDSQGTGCVNLDRDSNLGFAEVQPAQGVEGEFVPQSPRGIKRDAVAEDFEGFERESCSRDGIGDGELSMKKSKLSGPESGFDSPRAFFGVESQEAQEGNGNGAENPCNVEGDVVEPLKFVLPGEQVFGDNEISLQENAANELGCGEEGLKVENAGNELECGEEGQKMENAGNELVVVGEEEEGQRKKNTSVFDVLKFLAENSDDNEEEDDDDLGNASLLDAVKICGIDFPRPRWWPDTDLFRKKRG